MSSQDKLRSARWWRGEAQSAGVKGYLHPIQAMAMQALLDHQQKMGIQGSLAEVGVFHGKTLIGLVRSSRPGERVIGVDPLRLGSSDLLPTLQRNLARHLLDEERQRLQTVRRLSTDLSMADWMALLGQPARLVHLDGHHAHETILHDLRLAGSSLVDGGVVVLDDFLNELHPDLTRGMIEGLTAHTHLEPVAVVPRVGHIEEGGSKLVCVTRGSAAGYLKALDEALAGQLRPWQDALLGRPVRVYRHPMPVAAAPVCAPTSGQESAGSAASAAAQAMPPIVFCLHDKSGHYWIQTAVAMASVAQHSSAPCRFHVLHDDTLPPQAVRRMQRMSEQLGFELQWHAVQLPESVRGVRLRRFGPGSLFRLMIPKLFRHEDQVIYLDSDLVCNGLDLAELCRDVPEQAPVAAATDPYIGLVSGHRKALEALGLAPEHYFNSGVMLWRPQLIEEDLLAAFDRFMIRFPDALHPDQDFLNCHFGARAAVLDARFNTQACLMQKSLFEPLSHYQGKVVHFTGKLKPMDGVLGPGVLPFWMHSAWVPEVSACVGHTHYLYPLAGQPNTVQRSRLQAVR